MAANLCSKATKRFRLIISRFNEDAMFLQWDIKNVVTYTRLPDLHSATWSLFIYLFFYLYIPIYSIKMRYVMSWFHPNISEFKIFLKKFFYYFNTQNLLLQNEPPSSDSNIQFLLKPLENVRKLLEKVQSNEILPFILCPAHMLTFIPTPYQRPYDPLKQKNFFNPSPTPLDSTGTHL